MIREGTVKELTEKKEEYKLILIDNNVELNRYSNENLIINKNTDGSFLVKVDNVNTFNLLIDKLRQDNIFIREFVLQRSTLEEMFISLINQQEKDGVE